MYRCEITEKHSGLHFHTKPYFYKKSFSMSRCNTLTHSTLCSLFSFAFLISVRVHLWDLSGNAEYLDVRNELYGNTDAVFLVCDVTNQASFDSLDTWMREVTKYSSPTPEICLVANKVGELWQVHGY